MARPPSKIADSTKTVHSGEDRHGQSAPLTTPIAQTSVFVVPGLEELRRYAAGDRDLYLYSRYGNPTVTAVEEKVAALEGAEAAVATSSGMAAELVAALVACQAGDEIVSMLDVYGGTVKMFEQVLARCGIKTRFIPYSDLHRAERYFSRKTRMLFLETPTNPTLRCADLAALAALGHRHKACVVVDNTFATPILQKPLATGSRYRGAFGDQVPGRSQRSHRRRARRIEKVDGCGTAGHDPDWRLRRPRLCLPDAARPQDAGCPGGACLPQRREDRCGPAAESQGGARSTIQDLKTIPRTRWHADR